MKSKTKKKIRLTTAGKVIISVVSVVVILSILAGVFCWIYFGKNLKDSNTSSLNSEYFTPTDIKDKVANFLVLGTDYTNTDPGRSNNLTDFIMVVSFNIESREVHALRIPRDCYVGENVVSKGKINEVYSKKGGITGLIEQINNMFKIPIDHYATVDMDGIVDVVDKIGGLEMNVPVSFRLDGVDINEGMQTITGKQAEKILRERHSYADADLGRIKTQQVFMEAFLKKVFAMKTLDLVSIGSGLMDDIKTDMSLADIMGYYGKLKEAKSNINFHAMPILGAKSKGLSVLSIKKREVADILNAYFRPYSDKVDASGLDIKELITDYDYTPIKVSSTDSSMEESSQN